MNLVLKTDRQTPNEHGHSFVTYEIETEDGRCSHGGGYFVCNEDNEVMQVKDWVLKDKETRELFEKFGFKFNGFKNNKNVRSEI